MPEIACIIVEPCIMTFNDGVIHGTILEKESQDGKLLASGSDDKTVTLVDACFHSLVALRFS